jgi:hypothetical protein
MLCYQAHIGRGLGLPLEYALLGRLQVPTYCEYENVTPTAAGHN